MGVTIFPYQYSNLFSSINGRIHGKMGLVTNPRSIINDAVNEVSGLYLRSAKTKSPLAPNLFNDIYQYAAPSNIDGGKIIGVQPQSMNRSRNNIWELVSEEEFDIRKQTSDNLIAFSDHTFVRGLLLSMRNENLKQLSIAGIQGLIGDSSTGASWAAFGNATNLQTDNFNFIKGNGSLQFDLTSGPPMASAGVVLTTVNTFDLTFFANAGSVFDWVYIAQVSDVANIKLRLGNNASNYYELTATTPNDGTIFVNGWNLVRFDFNTKTTQGSPVITTCAYAVLFLTLASGSLTTTGYRFNWLNAKQGNISNLIYYNTNPWESITGTFQKSSTTDTDYICCDQDEYNLMVEKGVELCGMAAREYQDAQLAAAKYGRPGTKEGMSWDYKRNYPTEALVLTSSYYYMGSGSQDNPNIFIR
jgi:hypothetical protein